MARHEAGPTIYYKSAFLLLLSLFISACTVRSEFVPPAPNDAAFAPPLLDYSQPKTRNGSLFKPTQSFSLFTDIRAYDVGDILMVYLNEETSSKKAAGTEFGKSSSAEISAPTFGSSVLDNYSASVAGERDFSGSASSSQGNKLSGSITVTVYEVLPNGVLHIRGEKWITLNQGDEFIRLTGNVRVEDINSDNAIGSQRIADARITYSGKGALADSNAAGWLMQFFTSPWMPF
ncbi:flagellar L-ring protein [Psychromonas ingrahamii 37]|uniref:Flagellar L-ring protein n=1 Tax=Psychromonas ingrahamii (strain DSM 17664 / CCUG 51855 / 37) TaxID=357804 RepID=A1T0J0_PSYIN|nr:flagellar basal body L-ring protein FlgH [Psychromonas ingrahamii]ABM05255.1 flagellar L-ring protein [Psychromonas ingrahamii 37]